MLDIFSKVTDLLFPLHPTIRAIKREKPEDFTRFFSPHRVADIVALSDYSNHIIKATITANKFHNYEPAGVLLAVLLEHWLTTVPPRPTIFVPIPLSAKRLHSRGYNQVARVLTHLKKDDLRVVPLIVRTKDTLPQTKLSRERRFLNVREAFTYISYPNIPAGIRIVLIDDVVTTGATMHAAKTVLAENLPKQTEIVTLALAH